MPPRKPMTQEAPQVQALKRAAKREGADLFERARDERDGFGDKQWSDIKGKIQISFSQKSKPDGFIRRYYIGFVQFAYVIFRDKVLQVYLSNGSEGGPLKGFTFDKEQDLKDFLAKELGLQ